MPLRRPTAAGLEVYGLKPRALISMPWLVALAMVVTLDALVIRSAWQIAAAATGIYLLALITSRLLTSRKPRLAAVCENGLVVDKNGTAEYIDWRELNSITHFETIGGHRYEVSAKGTAYQLRQRDIPSGRLQDFIGHIMHRTRFEWLTPTLAARPNILERYRPTRIHHDV